MGGIEIELDAMEWLTQINQKLTFILLNIKEKRDISEDDYDILRFLHKDWFTGEHPLYKVQTTQAVETSVQQGLFADNSDKNTSGTNVDIPAIEPIKENNE